MFTFLQSTQLLPYTSLLPCARLPSIRVIRVIRGSPMSNVAKVLGPSGRIAEFWPEFESRPQQLDMAEQVQ